MLVASAVLIGSILPVSGWVVFWNPASLAAFEVNASKLTETMPEWTGVAADGTVIRRTPEDPNRRKFLALAKRSRVTVYGMASNYAEADFEPTRMTKMLASPTSRSAHIKDLVKIAREDGLDGIDLDYESLAAADRDRYSEFVEALAEACRKQGLKLSVTVHPKDSEPGNWDGTKAQDWARLGKAADVFRIMCYDNHWSTSDPGPIAPDSWVEQVINFAMSVVPARKIEMGVAQYGYDWNKKPGESLVFDDFTVKDWTVDPSSGERVGGKVWFSAAEAFARKQAIGSKLGVRGLSFWYIGSEDPSIWALVKK